MPDLEDLKGYGRLVSLCGYEFLEGGESGRSERLRATWASSVHELIDAVRVIEEVRGEDASG